MKNLILGEKYNEIYSAFRNRNCQMLQNEKHSKLEQLSFGLGLLEGSLLNLSLPFLESGENRLLDAATFIEEIKALAHQMADHFLEIPLRHTVGVLWIPIRERIDRLSTGTTPTDVFLTIIGITILRCKLENMASSPESISLQRSKAHSAFLPALERICVSNGNLLGGASDDEELQKAVIALVPAIVD